MGLKQVLRGEARHGSGRCRDGGVPGEEDGGLPAALRECRGALAVPPAASFRAAVPSRWGCPSRSAFPSREEAADLA